MKTLSDEEIDLIAEKAAEKAIEKITHQLYEEIGRSIVSKVLTGLGILAVALVSWFAGQGWIK